MFNSKRLVITRPGNPSIVGPRQFFHLQGERGEKAADRREERSVRKTIRVCNVTGT
jgi:hypothetical protein